MSWNAAAPTKPSLSFGLSKRKNNNNNNNNKNVLSAKKKPNKNEAATKEKKIRKANEISGCCKVKLN